MIVLVWVTASTWMTVFLISRALQNSSVTLGVSDMAILIFALPHPDI